MLKKLLKNKEILKVEDADAGVTTKRGKNGLFPIKLKQLKELYSKLQRDFPAEELSPFFMVKKAIKNNIFQAYYYYDNNNMVGYIMFSPLNNKKLALINYLAIEPDFRSGGYGTKLLSLINEHYPGYKFVLEVENPSFADTKKDKLVREKRIVFYERNGFHVIKDLYVNLFGEEFSLMTDSKKPIKNMSKTFKEFYAPALYFNFLLKNVIVYSDR